MKDQDDELDDNTENYSQGQREFVANILEMGFNKRMVAFMKAYPNTKSEQSANAQACRMLKLAKIRKLVKKEMDSILGGRKEVLEMEIFNFWYVRMTYDPTEIIGLKGELKITEEELRERGLQVCIDSINQKINAQGMAYMEYKLADRDRAADKLNSYIQMIKPLPTFNANMNFDGRSGLQMTPEEESHWQEMKKTLFPHLDSLENRGRQ